VERREEKLVVRKTGTLFFNASLQPLRVKLNFLKRIVPANKRMVHGRMEGEGVSDGPRVK